MLSCRRGIAGNTRNLLFSTIDAQVRENLISSCFEWNCWFDRNIRFLVCFCVKSREKPSVY